MKVFLLFQFILEALPIVICFLIKYLQMIRTM